MKEHVLLGCSNCVCQLGELLWKNHTVACLGLLFGFTATNPVNYHRRVVVLKRNCDTKTIWSRHLPWGTVQSQHELCSAVGVTVSDQMVRNRLHAIYTVVRIPMKQVTSKDTSFWLVTTWIAQRWIYFSPVFSFIYSWVLTLLYILFMSWLICSRRWCIDK